MAGEAGGVAKAIAIEKRGGLWLGGNGPEGDVYHVKLRISSHEISAALGSTPSAAYGKEPRSNRYQVHGCLWR